MIQQKLPQEVLRGKILATKVLVKKQCKEIKNVETEILEHVGGEDLELAGSERLEQIGKSLRDFYICIENALGFIAHNFDGGIPKGEKVHELLLEQMALPYKDIRPPVLDKGLKEKLMDYMQFRLDLEKDALSVQDLKRVEDLVKQVKSVSANVRQQLTDFFADINEFHGLE